MPKFKAKGTLGMRERQERELEDQGGGGKRLKAGFKSGAGTVRTMSRR